jgi:hypothetical protein
VNPLDAIQAKFTRLTEVRAQIESSKVLYQEHDRLVEELLPMFVEKTADAFTFKRKVIIGTKTYTLVPYFYNAQKDKIVVKQWKSSCFPTITIEG